MSEAVQFWLDNKMSTGIKVAMIGNQVLVLYRDRYYLVEKGVAHMSGRKPLRYSKSSLPPLWKKALSGETVSVTEDEIPSIEVLPFATVNTSVRKKRNKPQPPAPVPTESTKPEPAKPPIKPSATLPLINKPKPTHKTGTVEKMPLALATIIATCPYCNHEHELSPDKGKVGKSFFLECSRCKAEFAVRIVPVLIYQALVAGFE